MKRRTRERVLLVLTIVWTMNALPALAAVGKPAFVPPNAVRPVSDRLIVKLRASKPAQVMSVSQANAELSQPYSFQVVQQLQVAAGVAMSDHHAIGNGAHVVVLTGVQNTQTVAQAIAGISKLPNVEYVEEDRIETIQAVPTDPDYATRQWAMQPVGTVSGRTSYGADFETAWNTTTGSGVVVAVIDTGITPHPDIVGLAGTVSPATGNLVSPGYNFITDCRVRGSCAAATATASAAVLPSPDATDTGDFLDATDCAVGSYFNPCTPSNSTWHGTHVAGTIAAIGNNGIGVIGGAYGAKILPVRALGKGGGFSSDISEAILWAAGVHSIRNPNPAKVINLSLGSLNPCSQTRKDAIKKAVEAGAVVVVAAGNENTDVANSSSANCPNVISVDAVGRDGSRAAYSNFSSPASNTTNPTSITLAAQGGDSSVDPLFDPGIWSTSDSGLTVAAGPTYVWRQGTSMAAPHVSAAVALMLSRNPALTPAQVKAILSSPSNLTAFPSFPSFVTAGVPWTWDCSLQHNCGAGILNARLAVGAAAATPAASSGSGGGGGCSVMPLGANPDVSLLLALLAVSVYRLFRRRAVRVRSAD